MKRHTHQIGALVGFEKSGDFFGGIAYGQTVLARMAQAAGLNWDSGSAHSAAYDAQQTAELFCRIVNSFKPIYDQRKAVPDDRTDSSTDDGFANSDSE